MKFEIIDQCPVPRQLAPALRRIKARSGCTINSCDRSPEAEPYLRRYGKLSQRQLYEGWTQRRPGFNPANPPGFSTHERRNDGVAYPGPRGARLPYWAVGIDCSNSSALIAAARAEGFYAVLTYPSNPRESHHVNFRREPRMRLAHQPLRRGSRGPRVVQLTRKLSRLRSPADGKPYLDGRRRVFDAATEGALRRFQEEHHQAVDGIYGPQSARQLAASLRRQKRQATTSKNGQS